MTEAYQQRRAGEGVLVDMDEWPILATLPGANGVVGEQRAFLGGDRPATLGGNPTVCRKTKGETGALHRTVAALAGRFLMGLIPS